MGTEYLSRTYLERMNIIDHKEAPSVSEYDKEHYCAQCQHHGILQGWDGAKHAKCFNFNLLSLFNMGHDEPVTLGLLIKCRVLGARKCTYVEPPIKPRQERNTNTARKDYRDDRNRREEELV